MEFIDRKEITEDTYTEILEKESHHDHKIIKDEQGTLRWQENKKIRELVDKIGLNDLIALFLKLGHDKNSEIYRKLYRYMGYSLFGYWEIFYWEVNNPDAKKYLPKNL